MITIADYLTRFLYECGVTHIFGVSGANIEDCIDSVIASKLPIKFVLAKHEFNAACMADGYSRINRRLGVVYATSGGSQLNLIPALAESYASQQPVLAILGMPVTNLAGKGAFQDASGLNGSLNGEALFSLLASKYFHCLTSADEFATQLKNAVKAALSPPCGTAILMIPKELQQQKISSVSVACPDSISPAELFKPDERLYDLCLAAKGKTLVILGEEVRRQNLEQEFLSVVERLNAYVAVVPEAKADYDNTNPRFVGVSGVAGHQSVIETANQVKTIFILGSRLQLMARFGLEPYLQSRQVVYLNESPPAFDIAAAQQNGFIQDHHLKQCLTWLAETLPVSVEPLLHPRQVRYEPIRYLDNSRTSSLNFESIFQLLDNYIQRTDIVYADAGNTGGGALHYLKGGQYFGIALGMGGMGYALGASIGSSIRDNTISWCIAGDGAVLMHGMEIHTAIEENLPIRFIILNNNAHAMCYTREHLYLGTTGTFNVFRESRYGQGFAHLFPGFYSHDVKNIAELENHLNYLRGYNKPALLSLEVDCKELPPFAPFLQRLKELKS
ncbi:thiamine pyrophosphate-binding protein [Legionella dresdenensis]|uniref:Thiamine pyrophosphate-binding protein n=1 Tax=Legionella dresdenensis TaxID=450200 RepID=A0ABV8CCR3_9GAMM